MLDNSQAANVSCYFNFVKVYIVDSMSSAAYYSSSPASKTIDGLTESSLGCSIKSLSASHLEQMNKAQTSNLKHLENVHFKTFKIVRRVPEYCNSLEEGATNGYYSNYNSIEKSKAETAHCYNKNILSISELIGKKLFENKQMLFAINEELKSSQHGDTSVFFKRLQQNLAFLALVANQNVPKETLMSKSENWSNEDIERLQNALKQPYSDLVQLASAVGTKSPEEVYLFLSLSVDRHFSKN